MSRLKIWMAVVVSATAVLLILLLVYFYFFRAAVVVNPIVLPAEIAARGVVADTITLNALHRVPEAVRRRLDSMRKNKTGTFLVAENGAECINEFSLELLGVDSFLAASVEKAYALSEIPDWAVARSSFSLQRLTSFIKRLINIQHVEIRSSIRDVEGELTLHVVAYGPNGRSLKSSRSIGSVAEIEDELRNALLFFLAPEVSAYSRRSQEPEEIDRELFIAEKILDNSAKVALVKIEQIGALRRSSTSADRPLDETRAYKLSLEVLRQFDPDDYPVRSELAYMGLLSAVADSVSDAPQSIEMARLHDTVLSIAKIIHESDHADNLTGLLYARVLGALNRQEEAAGVLTRLTESIGDGRVVDDRSAALVDVFTLQGLVEFGDIVGARQALARIKSKVDYRSVFVGGVGAALVIQEMRVLLESGDISGTLALFTSDSLDSFPCMKFAFITVVLHNKTPDHAALVRASIPEQQRVLAVFHRELQQLEKLGLNNFVFYNTWGSLLLDMSDYEGAANKFAEALSYPGDHIWSYLNQGIAIFRAGDYERSAALFRKSLELGTVPNAVRGFLAVLAATGNSREFMLEYVRYKDALSVFSEEYRRAISMQALVHACSIGETGEFVPLVELSDKDIARFDHEKCAWLE